MASLNLVQLIGYLGKDTELKYSQNNNAIANLNLATDESYTGKDDNKVDRTEWHRVVAYGKTAELCDRYLAKGSLVYVEGSLQTRKWQDQNGQDRYTTEIKAQRVQFLDRKGEAQSGDNGGQRSAASQQRPPEPQRNDYGGDQGRLVPEPPPSYDEMPF